MSWGRGGFEEGERHLKRDYEWGGGKIQQTDGRGRALAAKTLSDGWWSDRGGAIPSPGGQFAVVCSHQYEVGPSVSRRRRGPAGLLRHQQAGGSRDVASRGPCKPLTAPAPCGVGNIRRILARDLLGHREWRRLRPKPAASQQEALLPACSGPGAGHGQYRLHI